MKFLLEDFGESEELNTFVSQIERRFRNYYEVELKLREKYSTKYFAYEDAAKKYYDNLVKEASADNEYYDGADITLRKIEVLRDEEELENIMIDKSEEEDIIEEE